MSKIKIVSNPYHKSIEYYCWDDSIKKYITINDKNSKLITDPYKHAYFALKSDEIVKTIWDEYFDPDENLDIFFEGTDSEFDELRATCDVNEYGNKVFIVKGENKLSDESIVFSEMKKLANKLKLKIIEEDVESNVYQLIYFLYNEICTHLNKSDIDLNSVKNDLIEMEKEQNSSVSLLLETVKKQNDKREEYIKHHRPDMSKIVADYLSKYVLDKKTLGIEYDNFKDNVTKEIYAFTPQSKANDSKEKKDKIDEGVVNPINGVGKVFGKIKKNVVKIGALAKKEAKIFTETDHRFEEYINDKFHSSFEDIFEDVKNTLFNNLCEREKMLKLDIESIINKDSNIEEKDAIKETIFKIPKSDNSFFGIKENGNHKFNRFDVVHHLPGVQNINGIRKEWTDELSKYIKFLYENYSYKCSEEFDSWESNVIKEITNNIAKLNPEIKEKVEKVRELSEKYNKLILQNDLAIECKNKADSLTSF